MSEFITFVALFLFASVTLGPSLYSVIESMLEGNFKSIVFFIVFTAVAVVIAKQKNTALLVYIPLCILFYYRVRNSSIVQELMVNEFMEFFISLIIILFIAFCADKFNDANIMYHSDDPIDNRSGGSEYFEE